MANIFLGYPDKVTMDFIDVNYPSTTGGIWYEYNSSNFYLYIFNEDENLWRRNVSSTSEHEKKYHHTIRYDNDKNCWIQYNGYVQRDTNYRYLPSSVKQFSFAPYERRPFTAQWYPDRSYVQTVGGYWINSNNTIKLDVYTETDNEVKWTSNSTSYPCITHEWHNSSFGNGGEWRYYKTYYAYSQPITVDPKSTEIAFYTNMQQYMDTFTWHKNEE